MSRVALACVVVAAASAGVSRVPSKDGVPIAVECAGAGPTLLVVHGGIGDRTRWTPMFPLLSSRLTVCAMDRRGHGASGDSPDYSLQKEVEDVLAVVGSRPGTVFVLGHSYGGVAALEAAFLTRRISKLILYEPPLQDRIAGSAGNSSTSVTAKERRSPACSSIRIGAASSTPLSFIRKLLMIDGSGWCGDNTSVLLFNMIKAGSLPPTEPGAYEHIA